MIDLSANVSSPKFTAESSTLADWSEHRTRWETTKGAAKASVAWYARWWPESLATASRSGLTKQNGATDQDGPTPLLDRTKTNEEEWNCAPGVSRQYSTVSWIMFECFQTCYKMTQIAQFLNYNIMENSITSYRPENFRDYSDFTIDSGYSQKPFFSTFYIYPL